MRITLEQYKEYIKKSGYKKGFIADSIGISRVYMSKIMQGERRITEGIERKLNKFLQIKTKTTNHENKKQDVQKDEKKG